MTVDFLHGVELETVLYPDLYFLKGKSEVELGRLQVAWLKNFLFSSFAFPRSSGDFELLCFRSMVRDDYRALFNDVLSVVDSDKVLIVEDYKVKLDRLNLHASRFLAECYRFREKINLGSPLLNNCCFIRLVEYLYVCLRLLDFDFKVLVVFADMQPVENLLVQMAKIRGRVTVTLQHGLYIDYGDLDTVNVVNYKSHCSDYFLAWGESTKSLIEKYHKANVVVCGKPAIYGLPDARGFVSKKICKIIVVVLDQKIFDEYNFQMLSIVSQYAKSHKERVHVRFHPSNNKKLYLDRFSELVPISEIHKDSIVIGHTTSMIYEALVLGYQSYRFSSVVPSLGFPDELSFFDYDSFSRALNMNFRSYDGVEYINCTGIESKAKYQNFFRSILGEI